MYKKILALSAVILVIYIGITSIENKKSQKLWREDFDFIISEIERLHPNPYRVMSKASFEEGFDDLLSKVNKLEYEKIIAEVATLIASLRDGHTSLLWDEYQTDQFYPVRFKMIENKLYVTKTLEAYSDLLYKEVVTINGYSPRRVMNDLASYGSYENKYYRNFLVESKLSYYDYYNYADLLTLSNKLSLFVKNDLGNMYWTFELPVVKQDEIKILANDFIWSDDLYGVYNYNFKYDASHKIITFNYNACFEDESLSFEDFNHQLWDFIEANDVDKIIIDLSLNLGGNASYFDIFMDNFSQSDLNERGRAYAIIGNQTYSAGTEAACQLKRLTSTILIGEPTGGSPQMFGNPTYIQSPNKHIRLAIATAYFDNYPNYEDDAIIPDLLIEKTIEDYRNDKDPIRDYIINYDEE